MPPHILLIDNYDSFTYNLYQYFGALGAEVEVVRNDSLDIGSILGGGHSHIVISPGPGVPSNPRDFGVCGAVIDQVRDRPVLGVCLGHQGIAERLGGHVIRAPKVMHGKVDTVEHDQRGLFTGLPHPLPVMRYHSWVVEDSSLPTDLEVTARNGEGLIMALRHRSRPLVGVQFHPESIGTPNGPNLLANFLAMGANT